MEEKTAAPRVRIAAILPVVILRLDRRIQNHAGIKSPMLID